MGRSARRRSAVTAGPAPASARAARRGGRAPAGSGTRWRSCTAPPTPAARSAPWSPCSAPARVEPVRSPLFSKDVLDDLVLEHLLGQELLQPSVLGLQLLQARSEEHTSELQSLMRSSYAVFCLKKKNKQKHILPKQ